MRTSRRNTAARSAATSGAASLTRARDALVLRRVGGGFARQSLDEPAPTIMADGIGGVCRRGWQYWVEGGATLVPPGTVPREGSRVDAAAELAAVRAWAAATETGEAMPADKPPYRVPTMTEIAALPWNGFTVASTFSGCGGSSLGYRMAGFRVLYASEFVEAARDSYRANAAPYTFIDERDIRQVSAESMLEAMGGLRPGDLDLLDGSPPCASFSTAGKRHKAWGVEKAYSDTVQRADDLFFEFARVLKGLQPKTFVAENVSGLVKGVAKGYFLEILKALKDCGYRVEARLLDAQWLGVPQARQRLIFVGVRNDLNLPPVHPAPLPYRYSIRDALPWISGISAQPHGFFEGGVRPSDLPAPTVATRPGGAAYNGHEVQVVGSVEPDSDISRFAIGEEWDKLGPGGQSDRYFQLVKPDADGPSPTITASGGSASTAAVTHPTEKRKFSIAELRRICGFPDDFILTGTYAQQWERLGRAVPPVMMRHIAEAVRDGVLARCAG